MPDVDALRIGTRASPLALAQAKLATEGLGGCELVEITTAGDRGEGGDKARFVGAIEEALLAGEVDLAVHSAKDLPSDDTPGLEIVATSPREDPRDALVASKGDPDLRDLPQSARLGTSSLRRRAQALAVRPDLEIVPIAGNVDTRISKLEAGEVDGLVLAAAGLVRLGRGDSISSRLDPHGFTPSPGQGTVAIQARSQDEAGERVSGISDPSSFAELLCERVASRRLGADCDSAIGVIATRDGEVIRARAWCGLPDGSEWIADSVEGESGKPEDLGERVAERLLAAGAAELIERSAQMATGSGDG